MNLISQKSANLKGSIDIPPNKSHSFRALILGSIAEGQSIIKNPKESSDWEKGVKALTMFGARIKKGQKKYIIQGVEKNIKTPDDVIDCGNSGILLRFLLGLAAGSTGFTIFTGDESLRFIRPVDPLIKGLRKLGTYAISTKDDGHAPVIIKGPLKGGKAVVNGQDSQTVSGLLIASIFAQNDTEIIVKNPGEKPWISLTIEWLKKTGIIVENINNAFSHFKIKSGQRPKSFETEIPKDWSSVFYPIGAALITPNSKIFIKGLEQSDLQGDKNVVYILQKMGAKIEMGKDKLIAKSSILHGIEIDCNDFTDQLPILGVLAAFARGKTILKNARIARHKESDRIHAMAEGLKKMGSVTKETADGLIIEGNRKLSGCQIDGHKDHRIILSFAIAGLGAAGKTTISDGEMIEKTFDNFIYQMKNCGANLKLERL